MKKLLLFCCFSLAGYLLHGQPMKRLLLFAEDSSNARLQQQLQLLRSDSSGIVNHNIWIAVFTTPKKMRRMYEYYKIGSAEFTLLAAGLGGIELFRTNEVMQPEEIYRLIEKAEAGDIPPGTIIGKGNSP